MKSQMATLPKFPLPLLEPLFTRFGTEYGVATTMT
jgi:hypothetical protein